MSAQRQTSEQYRSIDPEEVEQFSRIAEQWWDPRGKFKPLHEINPVRLAYLREHICAAFALDDKEMRPLTGLTLLDMGCGGGLISEPMTRMGASVVGIDASEKNIKTAMLHAQQSGLKIDYRVGTAESLAPHPSPLPKGEGARKPSPRGEGDEQSESGEGKGEQFDVVLALEIIEHVADADDFIASCAALVKPNGVLVMSTINRTAKSLLMAKIGAEYVLRLLPRGTHDWRKFVKPDDMAKGFTQNGLSVSAMHGMVLNPLRWQWSISATDLDVNYLMVGRKA